MLPLPYVPTAGLHYCVWNVGQASDRDDQTSLVLAAGKGVGNFGTVRNSTCCDIV